MPDPAAIANALAHHLRSAGPGEARNYLKALVDDD